MQAPAQSGRRWWGGRDGVGDAGSDGGDDGGGGGSSYSGDGITKTAEESPSIDKSYELQDGKVITVDNERHAAAAGKRCSQDAAVSADLICDSCPRGAGEPGHPGTAA